MPLALGGVETARRQVVLWDSDNEDEHIEAMGRIIDLKKEGFSIVKEENGEVVLEPPARGEDIGCFRILSDNGDDRVVWDRRIATQVREAFMKFKELMKKGYTAYAIRRDGSRGHRITEFDPGLEEIILGAGEAVLVPKTVPG
jgi:hypothetical protein